jgi:hypothetical protein
MKEDRLPKKDWNMKLNGRRPNGIWNSKLE